MRTWNWRVIIRRSLTTLSALVVLSAAGYAAVISRDSHNNPAPAVTEYAGTDQDAAIVDDFAWGHVPNSIADALRNCPGNENAWVDNDLGHSLDPSKLKPCLHAVTIALLKGNSLVMSQAQPGYSISMLSQVDASQGDVKATFTSLDYHINGDTFFAAAMRSQDTKGKWTAWEYRSDVVGIWQASIYTYQIAVFSYDTAHQASSDPTATLPQDFDWTSFMPQMLHS